MKKKEMEELLAEIYGSVSNITIRLRSAVNSIPSVCETADRDIYDYDGICYDATINLLEELEGNIRRWADRLGVDVPDNTDDL